MPDSCSIRVICRFRPINKREIEEGEKSRIDCNLEFPDDKSVVVTQGGREPLIFNFDKVFWDTETKQETIYNQAAKDTIEDVIKGYNGTIFAYGQTGSGKSFTMFGADITIPHLKGIIPRSCGHIFDHISSDRSGIEYTIKCSFLEIYKENVKDLLNPKNAALKVRETPSKGVWVEGLTEQYVTSEQNVLDLLKLGEKFRAVSATAMNSVSSRSHSLFILTLHQKNSDGSSKTGKLNLADLAGSEKISKTGASGETLEEAKKINQSLSALGNCINALTKTKKGHVPYRDSRLTHILRESLGGNCKTTLFITCSPHKFNIEETISTLKFGQRAKTIKNSISVNQQRSVEELNAIINKMNKEMASLRVYVSALEKELDHSKGDSWDIQSFKKSLARVSPVDTDESYESSDESSQGSSASTPRDSLDSTTHSAMDPAYDTLSLVAAQVEIERLKESSNLQIQELQEELQNLTQREQERIREIKELREKLSLEQVTVKKLESEMDSKLTQLSKEKSKLEFELKQTQFEIEHHMASLATFKEQNEELEARISRLKQTTESQTEEQEKLQKEYERLEREYKAGLKALEVTQQRAKELEDKALKSQEEQKQLQLKQVELDFNAKDLANQLSQKAQQLQESQIKYAELTAQLNIKIQEKAKFEKQIEGLKATLEQQRLDSVRESDRISSLEKELNAIKSEAAESTKLNQQLQLSIGSIREENGRLSSEVATLEESLKNGKIEKESIERKFQQESEKLNAANDDIVLLNSELENLENKFKKETVLWEDKLRESREQTEHEQAEKSQLEIQLKDIRAQMLEKEMEIRKLNKELNQAKQESQAVKEQIGTSIQQSEQEAAKEKSEMVERISTLLSRNSELEEKFIQAENAKDILKADLEAAIREQGRLERELSFQKKSLETRLKEQQEKDDQAGVALRVMETKQKELQEQNSKQRDKLQNVELELQNTQRSLLENSLLIKRLESEKEVIYGNYEVEKGRRTQLESDIESVKADREKLDQELTSAKKSIVQSTTTIQQLQSALDIANKEVSKSSEDILHLQAEIHKEKLDKESLTQRLQQQSERLSTANETIVSMSHELQELKSSKEIEISEWQIKWKLSEDQRQLEGQEKQEVEVKLDALKKTNADMDAKWRLNLEDLVKVKRELATVNSAHVLKLRELETKNQRIKEQEQQLEEVSAKLESYHSQLDEALQSFEALNRAYQAQIAYNEEAERISQQREMAQSKIVHPVESSWFGGLFSKSKKESEAILIDKEGWLWKQGGVIRNWQKRWFILQGNQLLFYRDKTMGELKGSIELKDCLIQDAFETTKKPNSFVLLGPAKGECYLYADSVEGMDEWIIALNEKISIMKHQEMKSPSRDQLKTPPPKTDTPISPPIRSPHRLVW